MWGDKKKAQLPQAGDALPGREQAIELIDHHAVLGRPLKGPWPDCEQALFGMGCFWGAERKFWTLDGIETTAAGYAGGPTLNPSYREVCSGQTGHAEVVLVVWHPQRISFEALLKEFFESHDPTQGMRQGNDLGSQYRSAIYCATAQQLAAADSARKVYQARLTAAGFGPITTEIEPLPPFYYAEDYHQQYLAKNPDGYCGIGGTGVVCPIGHFATA